MSHSYYSRINKLFGLLMFLIASVVYCMTIEPSASLWDCGEFIVSAYKLEVGHPPGAPFFMLTANIFAQFTGDPSLAARMVNYMSALMSAATILFLFLTITHLVKNLLIKDGETLTRNNLITIMAAGVVGALAYTFSDTFWFSAVEGEVYAYSSLFTALVFWLILKWEADADNTHSDRWLVLIAYMTGLSIGVHLLNLLCLSAIVLVYYYKKYPDAGTKKTLLALVISMILVMVVLYGIIPGTVKVGSWFELLFVNHLGMKFNSGLIFYIVLLFVFISWGIYESYSGKHSFRIKLVFLLTIALLGIPFYGYGIKSLMLGGVLLLILAIYLFSAKIPQKYKLSINSMNTALVCLLMILIGYSSYSVIVIRSSANPPMDQNSPEDIFTLGYYLGREQYGERPLFYGPAFSSERKIKVEDGYCVFEQKTGKPSYIRKVKDSPDEKDCYIVSGYSMKWVYEQNMFFPRMYSADHAKYGSSQVNTYKQWVDIRGKDIPYDRCGEPVFVNMPTQWENIKFFLSYQLNFMYWRYFMWNFAGRQNDIQGHGDLEHGNWITGFPFIDKFLVGDQEYIPTELKENKGRNVYYCLPLLLGIIGILWQLNQDKKGKHSFLIVFFLFFMTGVAIILYLNQTPVQVRERDYAYAGSFYAFTIWIGMGVCGVIKLLKKKMEALHATLLASMGCLFIPVQMAIQTWDDHDRSGRYVCRDFGRNYLASASEGNNPIVYTNGDNDTFPLWYNQEVEGFRTDIRTCNFSYSQTDWYIDYLKRDSYDSPALPIPWDKQQYAAGVSEAIPVNPEMKKQIDAYYKADPEKAKKDFGDNPYELKNILRYWVRSDNEQMRIIPTDSIVMKLDKEAILRSRMPIPESLAGEIPEYMQLSLKGKRYLLKNELMMLEVIAGSDWKRPVYLATSIGPECYVCFENNFCQQGLLYRITPFNTKELNMRMDSEWTYDCWMNKFKWGGLDNPDIYLDEHNIRMCASHRRLSASLARQLIKEGKKQKALDLLNHSVNVIPSYNLPYDYQNGALDLAKCYYLLNERQKADIIIKSLADKSVEYIMWYMNMGNRHWNSVADNCMYHFYLLNEQVKLLHENKSEMFDTYSDMLDILYQRVKERI